MTASDAIKAKIQVHHHQSLPVKVACKNYTSVNFFLFFPPKEKEEVYTSTLLDFLLLFLYLFRCLLALLALFCVCVNQLFLISRNTHTRFQRSYGSVHYLKALSLSASPDFLLNHIYHLKIYFEPMGGCVSTSSKSTCSSWSNGDKPVPRPYLGIRCCVSRRAKRTFSDHIVSLQNLASIPNRITTSGKSRSSCIFTQQGRKGINQDAMIVWEDFMSEDVTFCGVFDGHGPFGHLVARKVRDTLPVKLHSFFHTLQSKQNGRFRRSSSKSAVQEAVKEGSDEDKLKGLWGEAFLKSFKAMDKDLRSHPNVDCFCSGSTAVTILKQGANLFMGNIGDSRAILGSKDSNDTMVATQLTVDLKPDLPREAERIKRCKGRVFALQDEPEVSRVWLPFDDAPGLAMARAFGDFCLKDYGVISIPEFTHRVLTDKDQFIVLASDGIWDVLSNEEVVEIVSSASSRASAARILVNSAAREWKLKYPTSKMDDCAVVCLFLDGKMDSESDYDEQGFSSATNAVESDDGQRSEPCLQRNFTVRSSSDQENETYGNNVNTDTEAEDEKTVGDQHWLGLEGVTRVNSLVQLPRFSEEKSKT